MVTTGQTIEAGAETAPLELRFRCEPVPWWNLFFAWIGMAYGAQWPDLSRTLTEVVPGDLVTVGAIARGEADFGFTTPPACVSIGYEGTGYFPEKLENLRTIANFPHDDRLIWAASPELGARSIEDLRDKQVRVAIGGEGGPVWFAVEKILEAYGMPRPELEARGWEFKQSDYLFGAVSMGIRGEADVVIHEGRKTPAWQRLLQTRPMTFLPIREDVIAALASEYGFRPGVLAKGMLDGAVVEDVPTFDWSGWLLFTRDDVDEELVYRITSVIVEFKHLFEWAYQGLPQEKQDLVCPIEPAKLIDNLGAPLHAGAERYYRGHGLLT